jgi:type IV secretory pathway ATPase VirB11/archaellum biosynthesis ATPase
VVVVSKKAVVKRITSEEDALIEVLRSHGVVNVLSCLNTAISTLPPESSEFLRSARAALKPNVVVSLTDLVELKALTEQDANILLSAISEDRNIAVIGRSGSGKTTLLHALVCALPTSKSVCVIESVQEMDFSVSAPEHNIVSIISGNTTTGDMFNHALKLSLDKLVLGEIATVGDVATLAVSAVVGHSVMFTTSVQESDQVVNHLKSILGDAKPNLIHGLDSLNVLTVNCQLNEDGSRSFKVESE